MSLTLTRRLEMLKKSGCEEKAITLLESYHYIRYNHQRNPPVEDLRIWKEQFSTIAAYNTVANIGTRV